MLVFGESGKPEYPGKNLSVAFTSTTLTTLTCHTAKIMERFTLSRVLPAITDRLDPKQFAMAGKATQHAIVYLPHLTPHIRGKTCRLFLLPLLSLLSLAIQLRLWKDSRFQGFFQPSPIV